MTTKHTCDEAIREYRERHARYLTIAWAIAGGCIGSAIILLSAHWRF